MIKNNQNSVIIGANGYIGRNLSYFLNESGRNNFDFGIKEDCKFPWMKYSKLDVTKKGDFYQIGDDVNVIYFMAGLTGTLNGFELYNNYFNVNVIGLNNLLSHLHKNNIRAKVVFPSTRLVYKGINGVELNEESRKTPNTIYALTKSACEDLLHIYQKSFGINYEIFRICVPFGNLIGNDYSYGTLGGFITNAKKNKKITLYGDGNLKRTFTHIYDICKLMTSSTFKPPNNIYNIGGETFSLKQVANKISDLYKARIEYIHWPKEALIIESGDTVFCSNKLDKIFDGYNYRKLDKWINSISI